MRAFAIAILVVTGCDAVTTLDTLAKTDTATATASPAELTTDTGETITAARVHVVITARGSRMRGDASAARLVTSIESSPPIAANAAIALPIVAVDRNTTSTVDLFFPLPTGTTPTFVWTLGTTQVRTTVTLEPDDAIAAGETWWFTSGYQWATFRHQDGVITSRPPHRASVRAATGETDDQPPCDQW